jgi:hypothetical protein
VTKWIDPPKEKETDICWLNDLRNYTIDQLVRTLQMEVNKATETAAHYVETLAISLQDITQSPELEFKGEPVQSLYRYLLDCLYGLNFEKYPKTLSENNLDAHLINIVRISSDYFTRQLVKSPVNPPGSFQFLGSERNWIYQSYVPPFSACWGQHNTPATPLPICPCLSIGGHCLSGGTTCGLADLCIHFRSASC